MVVQSHQMAIAHGNTRNLTSMFHQNRSSLSAMRKSKIELMVDESWQSRTVTALFDECSNYVLKRTDSNLYGKYNN